MTKSDTIIQINSSWDNLLNTIALFSSKHERIPGAVGTWSFLEAVIHIFAWDNELLNNLKDYHDKKELPTWLDLNDVEVIELNQRQVDEYANDSFEDLYIYLLKGHPSQVENLIKWVPF